MRRIIFDASRWHLFLGRDARGLPTAEADDDGLARLGDELFERLYAGESELLPENLQDQERKSWAESFHSTCDTLPVFQRLANEVRGDAFAAGIATEQLLEELRPTLPTKPDAQPLPAQALRRLVGKGSNRAAAVVEETREAQEGLSGISWGTGTSQALSRTSDSARTLATRLQRDHRLRRIAALAGRVKRIAARKQRTKVRHGADEITDIEQGADLGRLLPGELARVTHPLQRLAFLRDLTERRCLQYQLQGREELGRGPLVLCLDKSGSMDGERDVWATAVALALLDVARRERRTFALLGFDGAVKYEALVRPGEPLPEAGLFVSCAGGTSIADAVRRGLDLIKENQGLTRRADIVLITDGSSDTGPAPDLRREAQDLGVTILGCAIGVEASTLAPWCDQVQAAGTLDGVGDDLAEALFTT